MLVGVPQESRPDEVRVALTPDRVEAVVALGFEVVVAHAAGVRAGFADADYEAAGAKIVDSAVVWQADIVLKVNAPAMEADNDECVLLKDGTTVVSFIAPAQNSALLQRLAAQKITLLAMDMVPRISRAQSLDALSAMSNIAGYRAVVEAANAYGQFFGGQMTAAGNIPPAKVLVIGVGVAGLSAIGAASSLGAVVRAFDSRPETREQAESLDAEFLQITVQEEAGSGDGYAREMSEAFNEAAQRLYAEQVREVDIIITTALLPGKPAPRLITKEMVQSMRRGSVVVDLAASGGGNCECTVSGKKITTDNGVHIIGYTDLAARLPGQASRLYAATLVNLLKLLCSEKDGAIQLDFDDVIQRTMTVLRHGEVTYPPPPVQVSVAPPPSAAAEPAAETVSAPPPKKSVLPVVACLGAALFASVAAVAPADFVSHFTVFILACIAGYYVVWNVTHALHTPLMSVTNAISGIIVVGALLQIGSGEPLVKGLAAIAVLIASINIFGGFAVTKRMLTMFRRKE